MSNKSCFTTRNVALVGTFSALWVVLNLTLGPLGFVWFGVPIFCDFSVFFTLLLATWASQRFGSTMLVGTIGSIVFLLVRAQLFIIGFAASAVIFDLLLSGNRHRFCIGLSNIAITVLSTAISAYFAGVIIGLALMNGTAEWALTLWDGHNLIGGIVSLVLAFPVMLVVEKAHVRDLRVA
jgi:hypothetical protein